uniref:NET domain-containing protein n=1 Tax=viral metagenome TaxID=1070528 RepID=A0A6C0CNX2_9ZZZZ
MSKYAELKELYEKENKLELFEKKVEETCLVVMRQTDYDKEKALEKLKEHDMVALTVVKEYMGIPLEKQKKDLTTNQAVYREFRTFLDDACSSYYKQKEIEQQRQEYIQKMVSLQKKKRTEQAEKNENNKLDTITED